MGTICREHTRRELMNQRRVAHITSLLHPPLTAVFQAQRATMGGQTLAVTITLLALGASEHLRHRNLQETAT